MTTPITVSKKAIEDARWAMPVFADDTEHEASDKLGILVGEYEKAGNKPLADSIRVIVSALGMVLNPYDVKGPFVPLWTGLDGRTAMITDFKDDFLDVLEQALQSSVDSRTRARFADVLWVRKRNVAFANIAIESYIKTIEHIFDHLPEQKNRCPKYLIRLSQIAKQINAGDQLVGSIKKVFVDCIDENAVESLDHIRPRVFRAYIESGYLDNFGHWIDFAERQSNEAVERKDFRTGQDYLECALKISGISKDKNKLTQLELKMAEFYETEAAFLKVEKESAMLIEHALDLAIKQYRKIGGQQEKTEALHKELMVVQKDTMKELGTITLERDRTEEITALKEAVKGKSTIDALVYLAAYACPPSIDVLKQEIAQQRGEVSIIDMIDKQIKNEKGKTVARKSGVVPEDGSEATMDLKIAEFMAEYAELSGNAVYIVRIDLAVRNDYSGDLFDPILVGHPLIPENRLRLFRQGFHAGLLGDYATATHILIPQFENSLRILFEKRGVLTTSLDSQLIQKENDLNVLLYLKEVKTVLHPRFFYMMRCLFVDNGNFNFRNYLAHGLISDDGFNSPVAVYIWIFLLLFFYHGSQLQKLNKTKKP